MRIQIPSDVVARIVREEGLKPADILHAMTIDGDYGLVDVIVEKAGHEVGPDIDYQYLEKQLGGMVNVT